jgi:hypothetical protein
MVGIELSETERRERNAMALELYRRYEADRQKEMAKDGLNFMKRVLFLERWMTQELATMTVVARRLDPLDIVARRLDPLDRRPASGLGEQGPGEGH